MSISCPCFFYDERLENCSGSEIILDDTACDPDEDGKRIAEGEILSDRDKMHLFVHLIGLRSALHQGDRVVNLVSLQSAVFESGEQIEVVSFQNVLIEVVLHPGEIEMPRQRRFRPQDEVMRRGLDEGAGEVAIVENDFLSQLDIFGPLVLEGNVHLHDAGTNVDRFFREVGHF